jgi:predicted RNA-binding Zn-ribbon protein involved in translation (DUF1610 family)
MFSKKFWFKVIEYAESKIREINREEHGTDQKCPKCGTWQSLCNGWDDHRIEGPFDFLTCAKCGQTTRWINHGIIFQYCPEEDENE